MSEYCINNRYEKRHPKALTKKDKLMRKLSGYWRTFAEIAIYGVTKSVPVKLGDTLSSIGCKVRNSVNENTWLSYKSKNFNPKSKNLRFYKIRLGDKNINKHFRQV